jgi:hypothetical protein
LFSSPNDGYHLDSQGYLCNNDYVVGCSLTIESARE